MNYDCALDSKENCRDFRRARVSSCSPLKLRPEEPPYTVSHAKLRDGPDCEGKGSVEPESGGGQCAQTTVRKMRFVGLEIFFL